MLVSPRIQPTETRRRTCTRATLPPCLSPFSTSAFAPKSWNLEPKIKTRGHIFAQYTLRACLHPRCACEPPNPESRTRNPDFRTPTRGAMNKVNMQCIIPRTAHAGRLSRIFCLLSISIKWREGGFSFLTRFFTVLSFTQSTSGAYRPVLLTPALEWSFLGI